LGCGRPACTCRRDGRTTNRAPVPESWSGIERCGTLSYILCTAARARTTMVKTPKTVPQGIDKQSNPATTNEKTRCLFRCRNQPFPKAATLIHSPHEVA
jgi:hypothetical protein